jgi:hypothetical protein
MQVHAGREHDLVPVTPGFVAANFTQLTVEFGIERRRARRCGRQLGRHRFGEAVAAADPGVAVDHAYGWDCEFGNALDVTSYALEFTARWPVRIILRRPRIIRDLLDLLFQRHLRNQQVGALLRAEACVHPGQIRDHP